MPSKREQLLEIMEDAAKGETTATLRARIAELEAEVERLTRDRDYWKTEADGERAKVECRDRKAEALSRTGAEKVLPDEPTNDAWPEQARFQYGDRVTKKSGASWTGRVCGIYSTSLTPIGYAVESENEPGSVQIYPEAAIKAAVEARR